LIRIKLLSALLSAVIIGAVFAAAMPVATGQGQPGGSLTLPGLGLQGFSGDSNQISLSVSIASQEGSKIYFLVNKIAVVGSGAQDATVYELNGALPGVVDTKDNSLQVDMSKISSYLQGPRQVSINDLYSVMRPDPRVLMIRFATGGASIQGSQVVFQVNSIDMIPPDGNAQTFTMSQPISLVYDQSTQRLYTVGFSQMYSYFNTFVTNIQNNTYTTVVNTITIINVITVTPPFIYPVMTPIVFPAQFPIYYPVPFPVPFPTRRPSVTPTVSPTVSPTATPTVTPTATPTATPTVSPTPTVTVTPGPTATATPGPTATASPGPTVTGTPKPTVTKKPTGFPTGFPTATLKPTLKPTVKPTLFPTGLPTGIIKPTVKPSLMPTGFPTGTLKPTFKPTTGPIITGKPTMIGPTKLPLTTIKPPVATTPPAGPAMPTIGLPTGVPETPAMPTMTMPTMTMPGGGRIGATMMPGI
jgi:hypothetical protein